MTTSTDLIEIKQTFTALGAPDPQPNVPVTLTVTSQPQRDKANELWLRTQARLKALKAQIKGEKDAAKAALDAKLAPLTVEQQLLEVMDGALERGIIRYDDDVAAAARKEQERQNKLYDKRVERAEEKAEKTGQQVIVAPPPVVATPQKTQAVQGLGTSTVKVDYTYEIPGCADPSSLKYSDSCGKKIPEKFWKLTPPKLHMDDRIDPRQGLAEWANLMLAIPESWFTLDLDLLNKAVKASKGEQLIPGVVIKERKGLAGRLS